VKSSHRFTTFIGEVRPCWEEQNQFPGGKKKELPQGKEKETAKTERRGKERLLTRKQADSFLGEGDFLDRNGGTGTSTGAKLWGKETEQRKKNNGSPYGKESGRDQS